MERAAPSFIEDSAGYSPFAEDPALAYPALRAEPCPVHVYQDANHRFYVLSHHADIRTVLRQPRLYTQRYGQLHTYTPGQGLNVEPPDHTMYRRLLNPLFTPARIADRRKRFEKLADAWVDAMEPLGKADFLGAFAANYAVDVAADVIGIEPHRQPDLRRWAKDFVDGINTADHDREHAGRLAIYDYFRELLAKRRAEIARAQACPDDVMTTMVRGVHPDGRSFTDEELLPNAILLLLGGIDAPAMLIASCLFRLLEHREAWERVCADPSLVPMAVEETLRLDTPNFGLFRTNENPVTLHGMAIPKDSKIQLLYASGNRDPAVFDDADSFRLDRDPIHLAQNQLAFGGGIHTCIGNSVARVGVSAGLAVLCRRLPSIRLAGEPRRHKGVPGSLAIANGFSRLPVSW